MQAPSPYIQIEHTVCCIPSGRVASYGQIADLAGLPGRARMVGRCLKLASAKKALPWHRVVLASGKIAFPLYSDDFHRQKTLLNEEGVLLTNNRVNMKRFGWQPDLASMLFTLKY